MICINSSLYNTITIPPEKQPERDIIYGQLMDLGCENLQPHSGNGMYKWIIKKTCDAFMYKKIKNSSIDYAFVYFRYLQCSYWQNW